jgi:hypothetical protein
MSEQTAAMRTEFEARLIAKAWKDEAFAEALRTDPRGAIQGELARLQPGFTLPEDLEITVLEETPKSLYLVVPEKPRGVDVGGLSEDELAQVAGGGPQLVTVGAPCPPYTSPSVCP